MSQSLEVAHEQKVVVVMTCRLCGEIDKTVEVTSKASSDTRSECRHIWETEKKVELLSAYEQMLKSISYKDYNKLKINSQLNLNLDKSPPWMFKKTYVSLRICKRCGEIDKTITSNFELSEDEIPSGSMPTGFPGVYTGEEEETKRKKSK